MGQKLEACASFGDGRWVPSNTMWPGRRLPQCQISSWSIEPFGDNRHGPKLGGGAVPPFLWKGAATPSNTMSPGPRPTSVPSGILIHSAIWPQQTWGKIGVCAPFGEGKLGPHLTQYGLGWGLHPRQVPSWSIQLFGQNTPTSQTDRQKGPIA